MLAMSIICYAGFDNGVFDIVRVNNAAAAR
jgi:hypothetical protein